jgi:hypothetical protein
MTLDRRALLKGACVVPVAMVPAASGAKDAAIKYRPHRGLLADSMAEVVSVADFYGLVEHLRGKFPNYFPRDMTPTTENVEIEKYGDFDERIGWDTHMVFVGGHPFGFTDGPVTLPREVALRRQLPYKKVE